MREIRAEMNLVTMVSEDFSMMGRQMEAKCHVSILNNQENGDFKVILASPVDSNYRGVSVTNYFENFATKIKDKFLANIPLDKIKWFESMTFGTGNNYLHEIELNWDHSNKCNQNSRSQEVPSWI